MEEIKVPEGTDVKPEAAKMVKPFEESPTPKLNFTKKNLAVYCLVVVVGLASGYGLFVRQTAGTARIAGRDVEVVKTPSEEGVKDASTFKDTATGTLSENDGKVTTEGTHILVRGDVSQNAYLTSSVIDLSKYVGKKVQIWGETFQGQKAGWLMDVGRIKVL